MRPPSDLLGWQDTRWGMTTSELLEVLSTKKIRRHTTRLMTAGHPAPLGHPFYDTSVSGIEIGNLNYEARFIMMPESDDSPPILNKVLLVTEQFSPVRVSEANTVRRIKMIIEK
jgi:hypothetical protein